MSLPPTIGATRPVVVPCDEQDGKRYWDVVYQGRVLRSGIETRKQARQIAALEAAQLQNTTPKR